MRILVIGLAGFMGKEVASLCARGCRGAVLAGGVDRVPADVAGVPCFPDFPSVTAEADCIVDFSHHSLTEPLLAYATGKQIPLVLATTGQTESELQSIRSAASRIPLFFASNYSLGIALLIELAKKAAACMPDAEIEIVEAHHDRKLDAPSGTALTIAKELQSVRPDATLHPGRTGSGKRTAEEIGIHSIRLGNIVGMHEVILGTQNQTITLKHEAHSRALFAEGALAAAEFLIGKPSGLYSMNDLI